MNASLHIPTFHLLRGHATLLAAALRNSEQSRLQFVISEHDLRGLPHQKNVLVTVEYIDESQTMHTLKADE
jgi:hypothetical protein